MNYPLLKTLYIIDLYRFKLSLIFTIFYTYISNTFFFLNIEHKIENLIISVMINSTIF